MSTAPNTTALAKKPAADTTLAGYLTSRRAGLEKVIPRTVAATLTPERIFGIVVNLVARTPGLAKCSLPSVYQSVHQLATLGLEPGGPLKHAYLVPYGDTCTPIIDFRGYASIARRSGLVTSIEARVVRPGDEFTVNYGTSEPTAAITHRPAFGAGEMTHVYAIIRYKSGMLQCDVMTKADVDKIRTRSRAADKGPWVTDYDEMAKKTVLKRLFKLADMNDYRELAVAAGLDDASEHGAPLPAEMEGVIDVTPVAKSRAEIEREALGDAPAESVEDAASGPAKSLAAMFAKGDANAQKAFDVERPRLSEFDTRFVEAARDAAAKATK